ncbi:MAG TPA: NDP-sugar synthase [Acidimicrobiia bacterium]|nr:NDP-sugar synthase [Acidimicrobiia bacterium]
MLAVVLVGGEGTRLRPLTYTTPKPLLPICNEPFLERQIRWLAAHGVDEVVLSMGYLPDAFQARFPDDRYGDVKIRYAVEPEPLGTGGAIRFAADGVDERFLVCNGDVLTDLDLRLLVKLHEDNGAEATISLTRVDDPSRFGVVPTTDEGRVLAFVEKPPPGKAPTDWINAGTYVLEPSMLDRIPAGVTASVEREIFPRTLESGGALYALQSDAFWLDIGVPRQYLDAQLYVLRGRLGRPPVADAVEREPGIWVMGEVAVDDDAVLEAPVLLGDGCAVAAGSRLQGAVLGPGCRVGPGAEVTRSVLLDGVQLDERTGVVDSIVGSGAHLRTGATLSEVTVVGAAAVVDAGTSMSGARIDPPGGP